MCGQDGERDTWCIMLVEKTLLENFLEKSCTGNVDVADFGYVKCGLGKDTPDDITEKIKKYKPSFWKD